MADSIDSRVGEYGDDLDQLIQAVCEFFDSDQ